MTIAIGVVCGDGLVLGTDLQYTGSYEKFPGKKLLHLCPEREPYIVLTGAGNPTSLDHVKRIAEAEIRKTSASTPEDIIHSVECGLRSLYSLHIDSAPKESQPALEVWLMLAIHDGSRFQLFHNDRSIFGEVEKVNCSGLGLYVGYTMLDLLLPKHSTVTLAAQVVSYVLALSKEWTVDVGKGSNVHMLFHHGEWDSLWVPERERIENSYVGLLREIPDLIACCEQYLPDELHANDLTRSLVAIRGKIEGIRAQEKDRQERRAQRAIRLRDSRDPHNGPKTISHPRRHPWESPGEIDKSGQN